MSSQAFQNCTEVTPSCPVSGTVNGYIPNQPANLLLLTLFGICAIFQIALGVFFRSWSFMVALAAGCVMELIGYVGRVQMHGNVYDHSAFRQQIVCLIIAPAFIAAGIYLSLKHIILYLGPECSRLKPKLYTWIFIGCDIFSIVVQAAGGGAAAAAKDDDKTLRNVGNDMMVAGIAIQVATMGVCGLLALDFALRYLRRSTQGGAGHVKGSTSRVNHRKLLVFCLAEVFAFTTVLVRCIYRYGKRPRSLEHKETNVIGPLTLSLHLGFRKWQVSRNL